MTKARSLSDFIESDGSVTLVDNQKIKIGTGNDLEIYHNGSASEIKENGDGNLKIYGSNIEILSSTGEDMISANADSFVRLYFDNSLKLATTSTGIDVTGGISIGGTEVINSSRNLTNITNLVVDNIDLGGSALTVASGDFTVDVAGDIILDADGGDVIFRDGGAGFFTISNSSLDAILTVNQQNEDFLVKGFDGSSLITALTLDMSAAGKALFNSGAAFNGNVDFADNAKIVVGSGDDLQIYHDGSNSYIQSATGNLNITTANGAEFALTAVNNGAVSLFHDGSTKLATTSDGVNVTGRITADNITVDQDGTTTLSTGSSGGNFLNVTHTGNEAWSFGVESGDGSYDYLDIGINGGTRGLAVYEGGQVSIGAAIGTPNTELNVYGSNGSAGDLWTAVGPGNIPSITIQNASTTDNNNAAIFFRDNDGMRASVAARFVNHSTNETQLRLSTTDSSGNTRERWTIEGNGNFKPISNGTGINFDASEGATATTTVLDDYEEGSFTPNIANTGISPNPTGVGYYCKIGGVVYVSMYFAAISPTNAGNTRINGLPYSASGPGNAYSICYYSHGTILSSTSPGGGYFTGTSIDLIGNNSTGYNSWSVGSNKYGMWSGFYFTSQ